MPDRVYVVTLKKKRAPFNVGHGFGTLERIEGTPISVKVPVSFDIAGDSSAVNDCARSNSAIDFFHHVIYIVCVVFRLAGLRNIHA